MPLMRSHPAPPPPTLICPATGGTGGPSPTLPPAQVWSALPPALRVQLRQTLLHVLQEVLRDA